MWVLPEVNWSRRRQPSAISNRYLRVSGRLKQHHLGVADGLLEVGVATGSGLDQVDWDAEQALQILHQAEVRLRMLARRHRRELGEEVEIAALLRVEFSGCSGAEQGEAPYVSAPAEN